MTTLKIAVDVLIDLTIEPINYLTSEPGESRVAHSLPTE